MRLKDLKRSKQVAAIKYRERYKNNFACLDKKYMPTNLEEIVWLHTTKTRRVEAFLRTVTYAKLKAVAKFTGLPMWEIIDECLRKYLLSHNKKYLGKIKKGEMKQPDLARIELIADAAGRIKFSDDSIKVLFDEDEYRRKALRPKD